MVAGSRILCVGGNLCSGKTTLVRGLAAELGWDTSPPSGPDPAYVTRIYKDPARWSFEAQLSFLTLKASAIRQAVVDHRNIVVDRSIYEDQEVFAELFALDYWDELGFNTYRSAARLLTTDIPTPLAIIVCQCSTVECGRRMAVRPREYQALYPPGHVERLDGLYRQWVAGFRECPLLAVDTELHDVREVSVVSAIICDLRRFFRSRSAQLELWPLGEVSGASETADLEMPLEIIEHLNVVEPGPAGVLEEEAPPARKRLHLRSPSVYLAAPFTSVAVSPPDKGASRLFETHPVHGQVPTDYKAALLEVAGALERRGFDVILPHRDVNAWGKAMLQAHVVAEACVSLVRAADLFVGILGGSHGAHVEAGVALALGKPAIFASISGVEDTFVGSGLSELPYAARIETESLTGLAEFILSGQFTNVLTSLGLAPVETSDAL